METQTERPQNCEDILKECEGLARDIDTHLSRLVQKPSDEKRPEAIGLFGGLRNLHGMLTNTLEHAREAADRAGTVL